MPVAEAAEESEAQWFHHLGTFAQSYEVLRRVVVGVYSEGFVLSGNFAYLALVALFSFCIVAAAIAGAFGQSQSGIAIVQAFFATVPPGIGQALKGPLESAMSARTGPLLWLSAGVSLWTTASLVETFRDMLRRAYGTESHRYFWEYRLFAFLAIIGAVVLAMMAFSAQVLVTTAQNLLAQYLPTASNIAGLLAWGRIIPFIILFIAIYVIFRGLTPRKYRSRIYPKWPGAALVSLWWLGCTAWLPFFVMQVSHYDVTYGSLAGVMVALIFFYLVGLGMVSGAQLNAALANAHENGLRNNP
jgi:membrane protein